MPNPVVIDEKSAGDVSLTMKRAITVKGKVTGPDGSPQPNVGLRLNSALVTDENGEYSGYFKPGAIHGRVLQLPKGMIARGGPFGEIYITVPADVKEYVAPDIQLERTTPVTGIFIDDAGKPIAGASVVATWQAAVGEGAFSNAYDQTKTDDSGKFVLEKTDAKFLTNIRVTSLAFAGSAVVRPGENRELTITGQKRQLMAMTVAALSSGGKPLSNAKFEFWTHREGSSSVVTFD